MILLGGFFAANANATGAFVPGVSGLGNNTTATALTNAAQAALKAYYKNSSDLYDFSSVDNLEMHEDGRITGDMVMTYKNSDVTVRLHVTLDEQGLTIRNAWGHVMGVYPLE